MSEIAEFPRREIQTSATDNAESAITLKRLGSDASRVYTRDVVPYRHILPGPLGTDLRAAHTQAEYMEHELSREFIESVRGIRDLASAQAGSTGAMVSAFARFRAGAGHLDPVTHGLARMLDGACLLRDAATGLGARTGRFACEIRETSSTLRSGSLLLDHKKSEVQAELDDVARRVQDVQGAMDDYRQRDAERAALHGLKTATEVFQGPFNLLRLIPNVKMPSDLIDDRIRELEAQYVHYTRFMGRLTQQRSDMDACYQGMDRIGDAVGRIVHTTDAAVVVAGRYANSATLLQHFCQTLVDHGKRALQLASASAPGHVVVIESYARTMVTDWAEIQATANRALESV